ncbi:MAG TPA: response regulator [Kofleriaceae bacterium]|nr:response regulator [Kofleriaceae bacterium]
MTNQPTPHRRLVIADDSPAMRWMVRSAVGAQFDEIVEASNGRELFWLLLHDSFASMQRDLVVITDLVMPTYTGLDVLDAWDELEPRIPTILITAFPTETVRSRAEKLGVGLLAKPFTTMALRRALEQVRRDDV